MLTIDECTRNNLCVDCDDKDCLHVGKIRSDCPKYHCDREDSLYEQCDTCEFIKKYQEDMRKYYKTQEEIK